MAEQSASPPVLTKNDNFLMSVFANSVNDPDITEAAHYMHGGLVYDSHKWMYISRPPSHKEEHTMKPDVIYPYVCSGKNLMIKEVRDMNKSDPAVSHSPDFVDITSCWSDVFDKDFLICKAGSMGGCPNSLMILENDGDTKKICRYAELPETSSLLTLPLRPWSFHTKHPLPKDFGACKVTLRMFLPSCWPILVVQADMATLTCTLRAVPEPLYPYIGYNGHFYMLDGWKTAKYKLPTFSRIRKLKPKELKMKLPSPLPKPAAPPAVAPVEQPGEPLDMNVGTVVPKDEVPPVKPLTRTRKAATPPPPPAEEPQVEDFEVAKDIMDTAAEAAETVVEAVAEAEEPMGETTKDGYTAPPASKINTEPGPDAPAEKKRTRKAAPVVPVGFDFGPVLEYTGSALPEDLSAEQIESEIRSLRDLGVNVNRRMANLTFAMRKCNSASDAKLKALAELLNK